MRIAVVLVAIMALLGAASAAGLPRRLMQRPVVGVGYNWGYGNAGQAGGNRLYTGSGCITQGGANCFQGVDGGVTGGQGSLFGSGYNYLVQPFGAGGPSYTGSNSQASRQGNPIGSLTGIGSITGAGGSSTNGIWSALGFGR